ncbi:4,5-DOPA-extradiol-dioxygenase [Pyramidobacter sp. C12-8]|uniref:4,5-DOPA-extradiol-dioxygenase n=1 Tax=Pyramidobacter sp. C12-8 TaxID=1943580 RepID=UPI00098F507A|nr:4,5-DOPA dioxygenase extradiol [Pyramidobacter sp. C12-8]OON89544.1 4,5-DOPA dioxygenase extradiol [Pyramidobacter sp. C12-8]
MKRMPAVFLGHGDPMIALADNELTRRFRALGERIVAGFGRPKAILAVSAHWYNARTFVQTDSEPRQVYDMTGFPKELYELKYPVRGDAGLSARVLAAPGLDARVDDSWGVDHGVWSVLVHVFPEADVPVVQLSVNRFLDASASYEAGKKLAFLRDEGYLILASGNVVHNLRRVNWDNPAGTPEADAFDEWIRAQVEARRDDAVIDYRRHEDAAYAVPSPDHFLPLLYALGASAGEKPCVFNAVRTLAAISMTSYAFGMDA